MRIHDFHFYGRHDLIKYHLPDNITVLGDCSFMSCSKLDEIFLPKHLKEICNCAFSDCGSLKNIVFPDELYYIGERAFLRCSNLKKAILPKYMISIGDEAFAHCTSLKYVKMPDNIEFVHKDAFIGSNVTEIEYRGKMYFSVQDFFKAFEQTPFKPKEQYKKVVRLDDLIKNNSEQTTKIEKTKEIER